MREEMVEPENNPVKNIIGVSEIVENFEGYIIDLWGVLHDGEMAFPFALETLKQLKKKGKQVCLLSNAPHSKAYIQKKMAGMGFFEQEHYDDIITSGEASRQFLRSSATMGQKLYHIGDAVEREVFEDLGFQEVSDPKDADFILNTGRERQHFEVECYQERLSLCAQNNLPMVCANPDLIVYSGAVDQLVICAGEIARHYEILGGKVRYFGKPHDAVYQQCYKILNCSKDKILAVGDAMVTDIKGANNQGISSLLIASGIHHVELVTQEGRLSKATQLERFLNKWPEKMTYLTSFFSW